MPTSEARARHWTLLLCFALVVAIDAALSSYLSLRSGQIARAMNLNLFCNGIYGALVIFYFGWLVGEWNSLLPIDEGFHAPPTAQMYIRDGPINGPMLVIIWMAWAMLLSSLPWHRAGVDPLSAVVCVSVCKMMLNSLSSANTASWVRVQRAKPDWRAFILYFAGWLSCAQCKCAGYC